jgi:hypothetical protein
VNALLAEQERKRELDRLMLEWRLGRLGVKRRSRRASARSARKPAIAEPPAWVFEASLANPGRLYRGPWLGGRWASRRVIED